MKSSQVLSILLVGIFLTSLSSATNCYATFVGEDISQNAVITEGENIDFEISFISFDSSIDLNVKMYDSSYNLIHTFENGMVSTNPSYRTYSITPAIYNVPGTYKIVIYGYDTDLTLTVNPTTPTPEPDTTAPVITLLGINPITVEVGTSYADTGATASDNVDGDITSQITTVNPVNVDVLGTYTVTYNVQDSSGNSAIQVTRTVDVVDTTIPIIILLGNETVNIKVGDIYTDAGATASDNVDGDLTSSITIDSTNVDTDTIGSYVVTYNVQDSSGNSATQTTRTVEVVATNGDDNDKDKDDYGDDANSYYEQLYLEQLKSGASSSKTIYLNEYIEEEQKSWFQRLLEAIANFFRKLFGN